MLKNITELEKKQGDCYIIASGASVGFFSKSFWDDKFTLGVNHIAKHIRCNMIIAKEKPLRCGDEIIVVSEKMYGGAANANNTEGDYFFKHNANKHQVINFPSDDGWLVVSWSTITSAMHLAAYLGFKNIFLCGHDCGKINGNSNIDDYCAKTPSSSNIYDGWIRLIEPQTVKVRDWLTDKYGVNICSVSPFVSMKLEGNTYA